MRRSFPAVTSSSSLDVQHPRRLSSPPIAVAVSRETTSPRRAVIPGSCRQRRSIRRHSRPSARFRAAPETPNWPAAQRAFFHCCVPRSGSCAKHGEPLYC